MPTRQVKIPLLKFYRSISLMIFFHLISACGGKSGGGTITSTAEPYCSTITSYSNGVTITGTAKYEYRVNGNGAVTTTPNPIRYAEISVYDSAGTIIQCGSTDASGQFSVVVPSSTTSYSLHVNSRISDTLTKAYVLNNPSDKKHYSLASTFIADSSKSLGTLTAAATGTLEGGAFNILDKVLSANLFLQSSTANCSSTYSACTPFTGAPQVYIYWTKGFDPGSYANTSSPLSYYLPGRNELYILGGYEGDTDNSDCDHFDNSIIVHEYGHFIEDNFAKTDSPGGQHNGDTILDARLAWGEGWGDFIQAAVLNNPVYRDTYGNVDGSSSGVFFNEDLENAQHDIPLALGEGNFREFSITRMLWDAIDSTNEGTNIDTVTAPFSELWTIFTSSTAGFRNTAYHFRNVGLFHELQQALPGHDDWSSIRTGSKQQGSQIDYSRPVLSGGSCSSTTIQAANISLYQAEDGGFTNSNQFASNDFYYYEHGGGTFHLDLNYTTNASSPEDLDLYLYEDSYRFGNSSTIAAKSVTALANGQSSGSETINLDLPAGVYMINIHVNTSNGLGSPTTQYSMVLNGAALCPN